MEDSGHTIQLHPHVLLWCAIVFRLTQTRETSQSRSFVWPYTDRSPLYTLETAIQNLKVTTELTSSKKFT